MGALEAAAHCHAPAELQAPRRRRSGYAKRASCYGRTHSAQRDIELFQAARRPGFETLQQQNPGGTKLRASSRSTSDNSPSALVPMSDAGVVLSVDPGQKGGPTNSFSVIQAWLPVGGNHLLLEQWRDKRTIRSCGKPCAE